MDCKIKIYCFTIKLYYQTNKYVDPIIWKRYVRDIIEEMEIAMIPTIIARLAMVMSLAYYTITLAIAWSSGLLGAPEILWEFFEISQTATAPPAWTILIGIAISAATLTALGMAYWSIEKILRGGQSQDFLQLSRRLRRMSVGLMGFWFGYNVLSGTVRPLLTMHLPLDQRPDFDWDPLDVDIILLIVGIALFAISHVLHRAWTVEEENKQFL